MYITRGGRRVLAPEARLWKEQFQRERGGLSPARIADVQIPKDAPLLLRLAFVLHTDNYLSCSWRPDGRGSESPWRANDTDNRIKAIQDAIAKLLGFHDQNILRVEASRTCSTSRDDIGTWALLSVADPAMPIQRILVGWGVQTIEAGG